jgi:hypothetical protein
MKRHPAADRPILYVYYPTRSAWWHAVALVGYDDHAKTFIAVDSAFGKKQSQIFDYGTRSRRDDRPYVELTRHLLSYDEVLRFGVAASVFDLEKATSSKPRRNSSAAKDASGSSCPTVDGTAAPEGTVAPYRGYNYTCRQGRWRRGG